MLVVLFHRFTATLVGRIRSDRGLSTAELLGNAALGIAALVVIWAALQQLGVDVVNWIGAQLGIGGGGA